MRPGQINFLKEKNFFLVALGLLMSVYIWGGLYHAKHVNTSMEEGDQIHYMRIAQKAKASGYDYMGGRNRMPLYPFVMSLFYKNGMSDNEYFAYGKEISIYLSVLGLGAIFLILRQMLSQAMAINVVLVTAFSVFIFKAAYFRPELMFYLLVFMAFMVWMRSFESITPVRMILAGFIVGIAHLTKGAILPGFILWLLFIVGKQLVSSDSLRLKSKRLLLCVSAVLIFLLTVFPYIRQSKEIYGRYFYNVSTTFAVWTDSLEEYQREVRPYGDRKGWPTRPDNELPSLQKYLREHSAKDILYRLLKYSKGIVNECLNSYGYQYLIFVYVLFAAIGVHLNKGKLLSWMRANYAQTMFILMYFVMYFFLYAWYGPIELGNRLILQQFVPLIVVLAFCVERLLRQERLKAGAFSVSWLSMFHLTVFAVFVVQIPRMSGILRTTFTGS